MLLKVRVNGLTNLYRSKGGLWAPDQDIVIPRHEPNVFGVLRFPTGEKRTLLAANLVTTAGAVRYAQLINGDTPTNAFGYHYLATAVPTWSATSNFGDITEVGSAGDSEKAESLGYPKLNDTDTDNTGKGTYVFTHKFEYTAADGNWTGLVGGVITNTGPGASEPILTGYTLTSYDKDSSTALTLWINHTLAGA